MSAGSEVGFPVVELELATQEVSSAFLAIDIANYVEQYGIEALRAVVKTASDLTETQL